MFRIVPGTEGKQVTGTMRNQGTMSMTSTFKSGEDRMRSTNIVAVLDVPEPVRFVCLLSRAHATP